MALASDLHSGLFYRAPYGADGYGGTRFFPLFFCLHATGLALSGGWRFSGYVLSAASVVFLLAGCYCLLRKSGVDRWLAVAGCAAVLAGSSVQDAFLTIREDGLAAALNVWGVALCAGEYSRRRLYISAVLFALAFATKETSVFGAAGLILALLVSRKSWRRGTTGDCNCHWIHGGNCNHVRRERRKGVRGATPHTGYG